MSQWARLTALCCKNINVQERINELYQRISFPYKFRSLYSEWIESKDWASINTETEDGRREAECLFNELIKMIDATNETLKDSKEFDLEKSLDFHGARDSFRRSFEGNYGTFVGILKCCMNEERMLIESSETENCDLKRKTRTPPVAPEGARIKNLLNTLSQGIGLVEHMIQDMSMKQDTFQTQYAIFCERIGQLDVQLKKPQLEQSQKELNQQRSVLVQDRNKKVLENLERRNAVADKLVSLAKDLEELLACVWKEIEKWQDTEKRAITALVTPVEGMIETLENMCQQCGAHLKQLVDRIEETSGIFAKLPYADDKKSKELADVLVDLKHRCLDLHLAHVFLVDRNVPDRVLKISSGRSATSFSMSVRILGGKCLGLHCAPSSVSISVFQEKHIPDGCEPSKGFCDILNGGDRPFAVMRGTEALIADFSSIVLKNVKRPDRNKNEELVTDLKYAFVFYTTVKIFGRDIKLRAISLPVILTSQTSQEIMAKGTLIWDAAFSEQDRKPFVYRDHVQWAELAAVLSALFLQNTGLPLKPEHLSYLAKLALKLKKDLPSYDSKVVNEKQILRDRMSSGRDFSFWKWFYANMNLIKDHVKAEWQDGLIYGFISKGDAQRLMIDSPCGTFLLRFSETNIENSQRCNISGCLTLAFVEMDPETGQKKLFHVREYLSPKELAEKHLAPVLDAMEVADYARQGEKKRLLRYLWPDLSPNSFEFHFGKYIKQRENEGTGGYRRGKYNIEIFLTNEQPSRPSTTACSDAGSVASYPATPQSSIMSPAYDSAMGCESSMDNVTYSPAFVDYNQQQQLRQTASVRPQGVSCYGVDSSPLALAECSQLQQQQQLQNELMMLVAQQQQPCPLVDQMFANGLAQGYCLQDVNGQSAAIFTDLDASLEAFQQIPAGNSTEQYLAIDDDGDLVIVNSLTSERDPSLTESI